MDKGDSVLMILMIEENAALNLFCPKFLLIL